MARYVMKFGGSSLADAKKLYHAAQMMADQWKKGHQIIGVLSAQGTTTDRLLASAREIDPACQGRELDALLSTGEQCSVSLCALALDCMGIPAVSLCGWQAGIETDSQYGDARILRLNSQRIPRELAEGKIVLVTGFQGVDCRGNITTLGRGGSDTTAVALAAILKADRCLIYTDVDGVYDKDPKRFPNAQKLRRIPYDRMLRMANAGAKVLHPRCVEIAKAKGVVIEVRSSQTDLPGTVIK